MTMVTDTRLSELVRRFGRSHAQAVWDAGLAAIDQIDGIVTEQKIDCAFEWVDGYLHASEAGSGRGRDRNRSKRTRTLAHELGFDADFVADVPFVRRAWCSILRSGAVSPRKYLAASRLPCAPRAVRFSSTAAPSNSTRIRFASRPTDVGCDAGTSSLPRTIRSPVWPSAMSATIFQTKLALYTSYVIAGRVPRGTVPDALFWDTADPYHYLRLDPHSDHDLVIFGGEDHKTGQVSDTNACYARLEKTLQARLPAIALSHRWSGQVIETPDGLPYIGKMAEHQYAATGFGGNGMTFGTLAAIMVSDAIQGRRNPWADLFEPGRAAIRHGLWDYLKENADYPYYKMRDRFAGAEERSLRSVKPGHGKVIRENGAQVAAYRRPDGSLTLRSATCTHMGCTVAWNDAERTWDCPCHGSRFTPDGEVISGPAQTPLAPAAGQDA